jgi:hypothetical protein
MPKGMAESKWLGATSPHGMLNSLRTASPRKLRLFACACCRHLWKMIPDKRSRRAIEAAELWADGLLSAAELRPIQVAARAAQDEYTTARGYSLLDPTGFALCAATEVVLPNKAWAWTIANHMRKSVWAAHGCKRDAMVKAEQVQVHLLRDIFGNPFRSVKLDPESLRRNDGITVKLAQEIYEKRAFNRLRKLADALEKAGCTNAEILNHCRGPGPHVRGCWVVDLLMGKE